MLCFHCSHVHFPLQTSYSHMRKIKTKEGCFSVVLLSSLSLLPHPFVLFWIEQVFASVITALAKWPVRVCAASQIENKTGGAASLRRVTSIGCPLLLANSGASWERVQKRGEMGGKCFSLNMFVWRRVTPAIFFAKKAIKARTVEREWKCVVLQHRNRAGFSESVSYEPNSPENHLLKLCLLTFLVHTHNSAITAFGKPMTKSSWYQSPLPIYSLIIEFYVYCIFI